MENQQTRDMLAGVIAVIGGFFVHVSLGGIYTYGSMFPYILQYMQKNATVIENNDRNNVVWILGLAIFGRGTSMTLGGFIENKLGPTWTILLGGGCMSIGYMLTFFTIKIHLIMVAITYGLLVGVGTGVAYGVGMTMPSEWFPKHRGLLAGIILAGFGLGSLGFDLIQAFYINIDITNTCLVDSSKVPISFIIMGCVYLFIQGIGAPMVRKPIIRKSEDETPQSSFTLFEEPRENNVKPHQLIFTVEFWIIWIPYACNGIVSMIFLIVHKMWGKRLNFSDLRLVIATSIGGIFSIFGRVLWGYLTDRFGYKTVMLLTTFLTSIVFILFYTSSFVGDLNKLDENGRYIMFLVWVIIMFFLTSGNFSIFPAICVNAFGSKNYTSNFGVLFTGYSFSGIATSVILTKILQEKTNSEYLITFLIGSAVSILSFIITLFYRNPRGYYTINWFC